MAGSSWASKQGVKRSIETKAFAGRRALGTDVLLTMSEGVPNFATKVGTLCWDVTNGNAYICTVATGTWVKINA